MVLDDGHSFKKLVMAATFLQSLMSVGSTSMAPTVLKVGLWQWRLPLKLIDFFHFDENHRKLEITDHLGFWFLRIKLRGK
jgi:hypothetical protein